MADQNMIKRGLGGQVRDTAREARAREEAKEAREAKKGAQGGTVGRAAKKAVGRAKAGLDKLRRTLGFTGVDEYDEAEDEQRKRKRQRELLGDDDPQFAGVPNGDPRRDLSTIAPEFRAQVSAGLAAANSMTTGSTLVDGGKKNDENW
jgi:hypothetical protein